MALLLNNKVNANLLKIHLDSEILTEYSYMLYLVESRHKNRGLRYQVLA